jgi:heme O synthase-like polyprenyltransferase
MALISLDVFAEKFSDAATAWDSYDKSNLPPTNITELNSLASLAGIALGMAKDASFLTGMGFQANAAALAIGSAVLMQQISDEDYDGAMSTAAGLV